MPCILKIRVVSARNLPVMDRTTDLTDAFVEIKFSDYEVYKTQTQRRSLNPVWNEDFRFEVSDDSDLQNEPLELKIWDYDQITYHDSIGSLFLDLNPLLTWDTSAQISGWFPIYDTLLGVRGELNVQVKLQFFGDINPFKDSSAGVQFFTINSIPATHQVVAVLGFVSAIDNEDDPEYHWSDNFRTPRTSNEARTRVMFRLSGHIRRQVGKKVLELKGNAVIGFKQYFDLESEKRAITARAIGTAVKLARRSVDQPVEFASPTLPPMVTSSLTREFGVPLSPAIMGMNARYSKSPQADQTPLVKSLGDSPSSSSMKELFLPPSFKSAEPTLITLHFFPPGSIIGIGGLVSATSIKLIDNDERAVREAWWTELRDEIRSHAKALSCPFIIGYSESTSINEELAVLQCTGTAAWIDVAVMLGGLPFSRGSRLPSVDMVLDKDLDMANQTTSEVPSVPIGSGENSADAEQQRLTFARRFSHNSLVSDNSKFPKRKKNKRYPDCQVCHITYSRHESPFPMAIHRCLMCKKNYVPEVLLTTIEPPSELKIIGEGRLIEAHVCRIKKMRVGDTRAMYVSESIPFCQYDIHRQLTHKLRIYGLNAIFGLKIQFTIGESLMTAVATGTAVYVRGLPAPPALKVFRNLDVIDDEDKELLDIQRTMMQQSENNRKKIEQALADVKAAEEVPEENIVDGPERLSNLAREDSDSDFSAGSNSDTDEKSGKKNLRTSVVVQIDDEQDEDLVLLMDPTFPEGFSYCNTELPPSPEAAAKLTSTYNIQMITVVKQSTLNEASHHPNRQLADVFRSLYQDIQCQVGYFHPECVLVGVKYGIHLPKDNIVQISLTGVATGQVASKVSETEFTPEPMDVLAPATTANRLGFLQSLGFPRGDAFGSFRQMTRGSLTDTFEGSLTSVYDDLEVFQIDDDDVHSVPGTVTMDADGQESVTTAVTVFTPKPSPHVEITPLSYIPQANIQNFLGRISLHFVKEATVIFEAGTGKEGMGGFTHAFLTEMYAITRAHAVALGGNAVLAFSLDQVTVVESIRNQAYALVSLSADVVLVEYEHAGSVECQTTFAQRLFGKV